MLAHAACHVNWHSAQQATCPTSEFSERGISRSGRGGGGAAKDGGGGEARNKARRERDGGAMGRRGAWEAGVRARSEGNEVVECWSRMGSLGGPRLHGGSIEEETRHGRGGAQWLAV